MLRSKPFLFWDRKVRLGKKWKRFNMRRWFQAYDRRFIVEEVGEIFLNPVVPLPEPREKAKDFLLIQEPL